MSKIIVGGQLKNNEPQNYAPSHGSKGNTVERNGYYTSRISVSQLSKDKTIKLIQNEKKMKNISYSTELISLLSFCR